MPSNKPLLDGASPRDRALAKMWQGAMVLVIGATMTSVTFFGFGFVWIWSVIAAVAGLFWLLTGMLSLLTGYE